MATDIRAIADDYFGEPKAERWSEASPLTWVRPSSPPVLSMTGSADRAGHAAMLETFHHALDAVGVEQHLEILDGRDHAFDLLGGADWHLTFEMLVSFLDQHLGDAVGTAHL